MEATFTTRLITFQETRFDYVIASLSPEVATEIRDLILKPPGNFSLHGSEGAAHTLPEQRRDSTFLASLSDYHRT